MWFHGPSLVCEPHNPTQVEINADLPLDDPEVVKPHVITCHVVQGGLEHPLALLLQRYSDFHSLVRAVAWLIRIQMKLVFNKPSEGENLTVNELNEARRALFSHAQREAYMPELVSIGQSGRVQAVK